MARSRGLLFVVATLLSLLVVPAVAAAQETTNPPATSAAPTTTLAPTTTVAPTTVAPTTTQAASSSPNDSDDWLLILVGIVIVAGIVFLFVGRARAQKAKEVWEQQVGALLDELSGIGITLVAAQPSALPALASRTEGRLMQLNAQLTTIHQRGPSAAQRNALVPVINASNLLHAKLTQLTLAPPDAPSPAAASIPNDAALLDSTARAAKLSLLGAGTAV